MGHIELAAPVSHIWYFKGIPSRIGLMLDISPRLLEKVLYFASYIVVDPGLTPLEKKQLLTEKEYREMQERYGDEFRAEMGAEAIRTLLEEIDLDQLSAELNAEVEKSSGQKRIRILKRLEVVEAFRISGNRPEWMILTAGSSTATTACAACWSWARPTSSSAMKSGCCRKLWTA